MDERTRPARASEEGERGFSLLESTFAVALVALGVGGLLDALLAVGRARALTEADARVAAAARDVLVDLRAAAAYGPATADGVAFATAPITLTRPSAAGTPIAIVCTPSAAGAGVASVVCVDPQGRTGTAQGYVGAAAPPPGTALPYAPPQGP